MTPEKFEQIWMDQVAIEKHMLLERAASYATHGDRLGNFYEGAKLNDSHPLRYAFNLVSKHIIALRDLIIKIEAGQGKFDAKEAAKFEEFVTDTRNYAVLMKAIYCEVSTPTSDEGKGETK